MESLFFMAAALAMLIGVFMGMLGGGGSIMLVPILLYVLKLPPRSALATSQLAMVGAAGLAATLHARRGCVAWKKGATLGAAGMLGAYLGGRAANYLSVRLLLLGFAALMLISAIEILRRKHQATAVPQPPFALRDVGLGFCIGLIAGTLGAGGGFLIVPALILVEGLPLPIAAGTSLLIIAMQSLAGALGYLLHVTVNWPLAAIISSGMAIGSALGSLVAPRVPAVLLRKLFAGFLIAVALFMLLRNL